jgi:hypothetical protein
MRCTSTADHFASGLREMIMKKWSPKSASKAIDKKFGGPIRVKTVHTTIICDDGLTKAEKERAERHARLFEVFEPIADWIRNSSARATLVDRRSSSALSRKEAALRLSGSTLKADIRALIKALHDVEVRGTAVSVLTGIGEKSLPHLRKAYEKEKRQDTRDTILQVLEHIKNMSNKQQEQKRLRNSDSANPVKDEMNVLNLYNEAASLYNTKRFSEARDLFGRLVRYDPSKTLFAYAMLMCLSELGVPNVAEHLPGELKDRREQLGLVFRQDNLANGLCIRGFSVQVEMKEHTANVFAEIGDERFLVQFSDVLGSIFSNMYRAASGEQQWERIESGKERSALERELRPLVVRAHIEIYPLTAREVQALNQPQNKHRRLQKAADFEEFVSDLNKLKQALIRVSQLPRLYTMIASALSEKRDGTSGVLTLLEQNLSAVCPRCGCRINGEQIVHLAVAKEIGSDNISFGDKGLVFRLMNGSCPNSSCESHDIIVRWKG